jgi:imidazoleglycerol phosphate synthase glutamine amidotransferase subunit HisH
MLTTIVDYGAGNIRSVQNTLDELGAEYRVTNDAAEVRAAGKVILPGVGHFGQMMQAIDRLQLREALLDRIGAGVPFLGICVNGRAVERSASVNKGFTLMTEMPFRAVTVRERQRMSTERMRQC